MDVKHLALLAFQISRIARVFSFRLKATSDDLRYLIHRPGLLVRSLIAFVVIGFLVGHVLGGGDPEHSTVLAYSTACRHPGIALTIAAASFPDRRFGATILLYLVTAFVSGTAYRAWTSRRQELR